jgi:hypothetical protein
VKLMTRRVLTLGLFVTLLVHAAECSRSPSTVTGPTQFVPTPFVVRLGISGSGSLNAPGQTSQLMALATYNDGRVADVTGQAEWRSTDLTVATVSNTGLVTAVNLGEASIAARYETQRALLNVLVQPAGTYKLSGAITEAGGLPLLEVRIEVTTGPQAGQLARMTGAMYALYGLAGDVTIRAAKEGFVTQTRTISMTGDRRLDVELQPVLSPAPIGGDYNLRIRASDARSVCNLTDDLKSRSYAARVSQDGARVDVTLSEAEFISIRGVTKNAFSGVVRGNLVQFDLGSNYYYFYGPVGLDVFKVVEKVARGNLAISGVVNATINESGIFGALVGSIDLLTGQPRDAIRCGAQDFTLVRR